MLDVSGPAAPPRRNGELVFEAPWQSRLFGVTMALHAAGLFEWEEFRRLLMAAIAQRERSKDQAWSYYACWLEAFETLLATKGLCSDTDLAKLVETLAARPVGHDHRHEHGHGHDDHSSDGDHLHDREHD